MQDFIHPPAGSAPVAIYEDGGGLVTEYQRRAIQYAFENRRVEIRGSCRSACVLALSVPNVCVAPYAIVKAHYAYEEKSLKIRPDITGEMLNSLPKNIKTVLEKNMQRTYTPGSTLTYDELRQLGVPDCSSNKIAAKKPEAPKENALDQILKYFRGKRPVANR